MLLKMVYQSLREVCANQTTNRRFCCQPSRHAVSFDMVVWQYGGRIYQGAFVCSIIFYFSLVCGCSAEDLIDFDGYESLEDLCFVHFWQLNLVTSDTAIPEFLGGPRSDVSHKSCTNVFIILGLGITPTRTHASRFANWSLAVISTQILAFLRILV